MRTMNFFFLTERREEKIKRQERKRRGNGGRKTKGVDEARMAKIMFEIG